MRTLIPNELQIEPETVCRETEKFIKDKVDELHRDGVILGLSGGIDSSAIVAMMAKIMKPKDIRTYTIGFRERGFDESRDAKLISDYFDTDHHVEIVEPGQMLEVLEEVMAILDEPFSDSSIMPTYLVSRFARKYVKVVLGGDGGDELFLGYPTFKGHKYAWLYDNLPRIGKIAIKAVSKCLPSSTGYMNIQFLLNKILKGLDYSQEPIRYQVWLGVFSPKEQAAVLEHMHEQDIVVEQLYSEVMKNFENAPGEELLRKISYIYIKTYLAGDILTKVDRASMANSLEVRAPFLDPDLAEFAFSLPAKFKLRGLTTKYILREALHPYLPKFIFNKTKHGFAIPVAGWFRKELKDALKDMLQPSKIKKQDIFNHKKVSEILDEHISGKRDRHRELWSLFVFQKWYERWA